MIQRIKVANHCFSIHASDENVIQKWLNQYQPFFIHKAEETLFSCHITPKGYIFPKDLEMIYQEQSAESSMLLEIYQDDARHYVLKTAVTKIDNHFFHILLSWDFREATIYLDAPAQLDNDFLLKAHFICENILRFLYAQNTASRQTICVHASAVEYQGKAYLFMGHSGSGKSTHSQLWLKHFSGTTLINDDNPVIRLDDQGQPIVYGSPWSGKTPCYKNVAYPLGGMTRIMQANKNAIEAYRPIDGYRFLRASASGLPFIDRTVADGLYETIEHIIRQFPVYLLACKPDKDAAELCKNTLVK